MEAVTRYEAGDTLGIIMGGWKIPRTFEVYSATVLLAPYRALVTYSGALRLKGRAVDYNAVFTEEELVRYEENCRRRFGDVGADGRAG